jgi:hypothetical protein
MLNEIYKKYNYVVIIPSVILNSNDVCGNVNNKFNFLIDSHDSTWHNITSTYLNKLYCNTKCFKDVQYYNWLLIIFFLIIVIIAMYIKIINYQKITDTEKIF